MKSPYLTTSEAAAYLRLAGRSSINSLVRRGELIPDGRRGRRGTWLFLRKTLDAWTKRWVSATLSGSTGGHPVSPSSEKLSLLDARPACMAGVLTSRPNFNAECGRIKL